MSTIVCESGQPVLLSFTNVYLAEENNTPASSVALMIPTLQNAQRFQVPQQAILEHIRQQRMIMKIKKLGLHIACSCTISMKSWRPTCIQHHSL